MYTRQQYLDGLRQYVYRNTGIWPQSEIKVEDLPDMWRHACAQAGVVQLPKCAFYVPETGVTVYFYFCSACGRLFYCPDFM